MFRLSSLGDGHLDDARGISLERLPNVTHVRKRPEGTLKRSFLEREVSMVLFPDVQMKIVDSETIQEIYIDLMFVSYGVEGELGLREICWLNNNIRASCTI